MMSFAGGWLGGKMIAGCISSETAANTCLRDLGFEDVTHGHWIHEITKIIVWCLPDFVFDFLSWYGWTLINKSVKE